MFFKVGKKDSSSGVRLVAAQEDRLHGISLSIATVNSSAVREDRGIILV